MTAIRATSSPVPARRTITLAIVLVLASAPALFGCKAEADAGAARGAPKKLHFAFVTNDSSDFWKGEMSDQQRSLEDILVRDFDGVAISPNDSEATTPLLGKGR